MSDEPKPGTNRQQPSAEEPGDSSWREERRERREEWRREGASRHGGAWVGGVVLIVLGIVFLLRSMGLAGGFLRNWWALFILIPAAGAFGAAWRSYQSSGGRLDGAASGSLIGGLVLTVVALVFLLNLQWGSLWPVLLILGGVGMLLGALWRRP